MCRLSGNLGASTSWNPRGQSRDSFTLSFASNSDQGQKGQVPSIRQLNRLDTRHKKHEGMRIEYHACSVKNKATKKFKYLERNVKLCATPCFEVHHTKLHFWWPTDTNLEKGSTQTYIYIATAILNLYFSVALSWWNNGVVKGVWISQNASWKNKDYSERSLYMYLLSITT
jgi:hypothetical protein